MNKIVVGLGIFVTTAAIAFTVIRTSTKNDLAVMKLRNNQFVTPGFLYAKSGIYKNGYAFDAYTFNEGINIKPDIQARAKQELKNFTGCVEVNLESWNDKKQNKKSTYRQVTDFKKTDCPEML